MEWTDQQSDALKAIRHWAYFGPSQGKPTFYLAGYAGSGKTTLAREFENIVHGKVAYACFTGKAAAVLSSKIDRPVGTIHSLIYETVYDEKQDKLVTHRKAHAELAKYALIVLDEVSMINDELARDLLSYRIPILAIGDPEQIPPVGGEGYFTKGEPDFMLTEVHRQALESPIIRLATEIREGLFQQRKEITEGLSMGYKRDIDPELIHSADTYLCGTNATRKNLNDWRRKGLGFSGIWPAKGETLIGLKNDKDTGICNGQTFEIMRRGVPEKKYGTCKFVLVDSASGKPSTYEARIPRQCFEDDQAAMKDKNLMKRKVQMMTYGYALTCHKSQGSQWKNVCVFDESFIFRDSAKKWLYTAVTRASDHLTLVFKG